MLGAWTDLEECAYNQIIMLIDFTNLRVYRRWAVHTVRARLHLHFLLAILSQVIKPMEDEIDHEVARDEPIGIEGF